MDTEYRRAANITIVFAGIAFAAWLFLKYALGAAIPFLLAALVGGLISPLAQKIADKTRLSRKFCSAILVILFFLAVSSLIGFVCSKLMEEIGNLLLRLEEDPTLITDPLDQIASAFSGLSSRFVFIEKISQSRLWQSLGLDMDQLLSDAFSSAVGALTSALPSAAINMAAKIPSALLFTAVFLISAFYFASDGQAIGRGLSSCLPEKWQKKLPHLRMKIKHALTGYLKAYLLIMLLTFAQVFLGLSILRVNYAFLLALLVAVVDLLPILGTGTVLVPWAIFSIFTGNVPLGTGLLILYAVTVIVRQLAEPKIVGNSIGLHPLATLASIYLSLRFFGLAGLFLGPILALLLQNLFGKEAAAKTEKRKKETPQLFSPKSRSPKMQ